MSELVGVSGRVGSETVNKKDVRPIEVGDRFETRDKRNAGRVVEVIEALPVLGDETRAERSERVAILWCMKPDDVDEWLRQRETRFRIRTEAHPRNPDAVGKVSDVHEATLRTDFRRVSR